MPTREEVLVKLGAPQRAARSHASAGSRLVTRPGFARSLAGATGIFTVREEALDAYALAARLRAIPLDSFLPDAPRRAQEFPAPTPLLARCNIVVTASPVVPVVTETTETRVAERVADGQPFAGTGGATFVMSYLDMTRVGAEFAVAQSALQDPGLVEGIVDRLLEKDWSKAVERDIVATIMAMPGLHTVTVSGNPVDAIADAVATVQGNGFLTGHLAVARPEVLAGVLKTKTTTDEQAFDWDSELVTMTDQSWIPAQGVDSGTLLVCDPAEIDVYVASGFTVEFSSGYTDVATSDNYFSSGKVRCVGWARCATWIRNPGAVCVVDGL
jgi:hypothetical protein